MSSASPRAKDSKVRSLSWDNNTTGILYNLSHYYHMKPVDILFTTITTIADKLTSIQWKAARWNTPCMLVTWYWVYTNAKTSCAMCVSYGIVMMSNPASVVGIRKQHFAELWYPCMTVQMETDKSAAVLTVALTPYSLRFVRFHDKYMLYNCL